MTSPIPVSVWLNGERIPGGDASIEFLPTVDSPPASLVRATPISCNITIVGDGSTRFEDNIKRACDIARAPIPAESILMSDRLLDHLRHDVIGQEIIRRRIEESVFVSRTEEQWKRHIYGRWVLFTPEHYENNADTLRYVRARSKTALGTLGYEALK